MNCLEITPDKNYLAAGGNPHIRLFEINNNSNSNAILCLEGHTSNVTSLGFQRNGRYLYSGSEDGSVKIWDLRSPTFTRSFDAKGPVNSVALHPNQAQIISGDQSGSVKIFDLGSSKVISEIVPESYSSTQAVSIQAVDVSDDSRLLVAANNHAEVFAYNMNEAIMKAPKGQQHYPLASFRAHPLGAYLLHAKISPDCRCKHDRHVSLFVTSLTSAEITAALVSVSSDKTARLFDTTTWQLTQTLSQHKRWVKQSVFSADSSYLVTASSDRSALLWNLRTGSPVRQYSDHEASVTCVALNDRSES